MANTDLSDARIAGLGLAAGVFSFLCFHLFDVSPPAGPLPHDSAQAVAVSRAAETPSPVAVSAPMRAEQVAEAQSVHPLTDFQVQAWPEIEPLAVPEYREVSHRIQEGESVSKVLTDYGVSAFEADRWITETRSVYSLHRVYVGQRLNVKIDRRSGKILSLEMEIDPRTNFVARLDKDSGKIIASREPVALESSLRVVKGRITTSFYAAAAESKVPDKVISEIAEILGWDINFATDLRPGAEFKIVYEELTRAEGARKIPGRVLAVQIESRRRTHEGVYFSSPEDGTGAYYNRKGESLGRDFLRYPVAFTRISSNYGGRYHPVLKTRKPHYGVDFAAPVGTPVRSVADGKILLAGWKGGNGRFVKIRHDETYESGYAHLSRIASGIRPGAYVSKGQVIGYVGASGLATGPHLHFAMYRNGKYINPLSANMPRSRSLSGPALDAFRKKVAGVDQVYAKADATGSAIVMAAAPELR